MPKAYNNWSKFENAVKSQIQKALTQASQKNTGVVGQIKLKASFNKAHNSGYYAYAIFQKKDGTFDCYVQYRQEKPLDLTTGWADHPEHYHGVKIQPNNIFYDVNRSEGIHFYQPVEICEKNIGNLIKCKWEYEQVTEPTIVPMQRKQAQGEDRLGMSKRVLKLHVLAH